MDNVNKLEPVFPCEYQDPLETMELNLDVVEIKLAQIRMQIYESKYYCTSGHQSRAMKCYFKALAHKDEANAYLQAANIAFEKAISMKLIYGAKVATQDDRMTEYKIRLIDAKKEIDEHYKDLYDKFGFAVHHKK